MLALTIVALQPTTLGPTAEVFSRPPASSSATSAPVSRGLLGWQVTASNVGLVPFGLDCAGLPVLSDGTWPGHVVPAGTRIFRKRLTGWYDLSAGNITIEQSCIQPERGAIGTGSAALSTWSDSRSPDGPVVVKDSECDGSLLDNYSAAWTGCALGAISFYRTYIHHFGSGLNSYGTYTRSGDDIVIENNLVRDLVAYGDPSGGGNHQSAYTVRDVDVSTNPDRRLMVRNNRLVGDGANMSGTLFLQPNADSIRNVYISGNLVTGTNGYQLYVDQDAGRFGGSTYSNIHFTNNRISDSGYGAVFVRDGVPAFAQWSQNYVYDPAAPDGKGKTITDPN